MTNAPVGNAHRIARSLTAAAVCALLVGCGTAQTDLSQEDTEALGPAKCPSGQLVGVGVDTQRSAMDDVAAAYAERCSYRESVRYEAASADAGLRAFVTEKGTPTDPQSEAPAPTYAADWAGIDGPLTDAERGIAQQRCTSGDVWALPLVASPVAITVNLSVDRLVLTPEVLGRALDGGITRWNDPAVAALNPGVALPDEPITVVARSDANGATGELTRFLAETRAWPADRVSETWPVAGELKGSTSDVVRTLRGTTGAVGYTDLSTARDNGLTVVSLDLGAGPVDVTPETTAAGLAHAEITGTGGDVRVLPAYAEAAPGAYPLHVVSYQVICGATGDPRPQAALLKDFLGFLASDPQQDALAAVGYTPVPPAAREATRQAIGELG